MVVSRLGEARFVDPNTKIVLSTVNVPYGSSLYFKGGEPVDKNVGAAPKKVFVEKLEKLF